MDDLLCLGTIVLERRGEGTREELGAEQEELEAAVEKLEAEVEEV